MLVLSRRPDEKILLPSVPAVIKVISSQAGVVRLGIEAPAHVPILREELVRREPVVTASADSSDDLRHEVRNRLHNLMLGLSLLRRHAADAVVRKTLDGMQSEIEALRRCLAACPAGGEAVGEPLAV